MRRQTPEKDHLSSKWIFHEFKYNLLVIEYGLIEQMALYVEFLYLIHHFPPDPYKTQIVPREQTNERIEIPFNLPFNTKNESSNFIACFFLK